MSLSPDMRFALVAHTLFPSIGWNQWTFESTRDGGCRVSSPTVLGAIRALPDGVHFGGYTQIAHPTLGQFATWEQIETYCASLQEDTVSPRQQRIQESVRALRAAGLNELANLVASAPEGCADTLAWEVSQLVRPSGQRLTFG